MDAPHKPTPLDDEKRKQLAEEIYYKPKTYDQIATEREDARKMRRARYPAPPKRTIVAVITLLVIAFLITTRIIPYLLPDGLTGVSLAMLVAIVFAFLVYLGVKKIRSLTDIVD